MAEDKYDKFRNKYCLENPKYNLIKKLSPFEASVAIFFIIGIPTEIIVREKSGIILAFIFAFFTFFYVKHLHKEFSKAWEKRFGDK
tara:strand:- start:619 stop:876 length:258 start_codon:yes stop_codon:yes gene_type:complete